MNTVYPWHRQIYIQLNEALAQNRLPHALLFCCAEGFGADEFARYWSQKLLCSNNIEGPCGQCKHCLLVQAQTHPDFYWIEKEDGKKQISIQQIRELTEHLHEKATMSGWRVAVINQAEKMTVNGFNALLKTLEEPGKSIQIILIARLPEALPATIRSRCQQFGLQPTSSVESLKWLMEKCPEMTKEQQGLAMLLARNAPLTARQAIQQGQIEEFYRLIECFYDIFFSRVPINRLLDSVNMEPLRLLNYFEIIVQQVIRIAQHSGSTMTQAPESLLKLAEFSDVRLLFTLRDNILFQLKELQEGVALNFPMQIDALAQQWFQCQRKSSASKAQDAVRR